MSAKAYKLAVFEQGKGRPVILLHGIVSTHRYWQSVAELLEGERTLIMPDLLGFGDSPKPRRGLYVLEQYLACLDRTFGDYTFSEPPLLVGHSMGALIALRWAVMYPQRFSGLVLCSPVFIEAARLHQQLSTIPLEGRYLSSKLQARVVSRAMGWSGLVPSRLAGRVVRKWPRHIIEDATSHRAHVYRKLLRNKHFTEHVLRDLQQADLPLRLLIGRHDPTSYHALEQVELVCRAKTSCRIQVLDTGHQLPLEEPEIVAKTILSV